MYICNLSSFLTTHIIVLTLQRDLHLQFLLTNRISAFFPSPRGKWARQCEYQLRQFETSFLVATGAIIRQIRWRSHWSSGSQLLIAGLKLQLNAHFSTLTNVLPRKVRKELGAQRVLLWLTIKRIQHIRVPLIQKRRTI